MVTCECGATGRARRVSCMQGFPVWRWRCTRCDLWWCKRGHQTGPGYQRIWVGDGFACLQGECGQFHKTWWLLYRSRDKLTPAKRSRLQERAWQRRDGQAEAIRDFLRVRR